VVVDVDQWLRGVGLQQYALPFAENHIDGSILPELTADDLVALGINSVGHRRRLLSAIAVLRSEQLVAPQTTATTSGEAERRQLTCRRSAWA
jgi:hypothetical protein